MLIVLRVRVAHLGILSPALSPNECSKPVLVFCVAYSYLFEAKLDRMKWLFSSFVAVQCAARYLGS